jgi:NADP-dependent 3-hydroxy acid dehydrogenase YdfG
MADDLTVLLGASGALGRRIALGLGGRRSSLLLVGRTHTRLRELAARLPGSAAVCALDITAGDIEPLLGIIERCPSPLRRLVIVDAVLDKTSTRAMRRSLRGAVRVVEALVSWGRQQDHEVFVVGANSVAAHARWPNSTTYGRLKGQQAAAYRASAAPAAIVYAGAAQANAPARRGRERSPISGCDRLHRGRASRRGPGPRDGCQHQRSGPRHP